MRAAATGGVPTTAMGTVLAPAVGQLSTDGVGLETDPVFEGNEEFYVEDLGAL